MHFGSILGLAKAVHYLCDIGIKKIQTHDLMLADRLLEGIQTLEQVEVVSATAPCERSPIVTVRVLGLDTQMAVDLLKEADIIITNRSGLLRFSPHLYNTVDDMDTIIDNLRGIILRHAEASDEAAGDCTSGKRAQQCAETQAGSPEQVTQLTEWLK